MTTRSTPGRRGLLADQLHEALVSQGLSPIPGGARVLLDAQITRVAAQLRMSEAVVLRQFGDHEITLLAETTAKDWHASQAVAEAAGEIAVGIGGRDAAQLIMGLAMAVGQVIREVHGDLPAAAGQPLDALCELGAALRDGLSETSPGVAVTLEVLTSARETLLRAAQGVEDGTVPVVLADDQRGHFAEQLRADADLAEALAGLNGSPPDS